MCDIFLYWTLFFIFAEQHEIFVMASASLPTCQFISVLFSQKRATGINNIDQERSVPVINYYLSDTYILQLTGIKCGVNKKPIILYWYLMAIICDDIRTSIVTIVTIIRYIYMYEFLGIIQSHQLSCAILCNAMQP